VYALGVIFYEMLTGNLPLGRCLPPSQSGSDPRLDEVVLKSLEREPDKRWQTVNELRQAVALIQAGMPTTLPSKVADRRPWPLQLIGGLVAVTALVLLVFMWSRPAQAIASPAPPVSPPQEKSPVAEARLDEVVKEAKRVETTLAALELRKSEMERKVKDLTGQTALAEADATKATTALESVNDVERFTKQRQELTQELEAAMKTIRTKADETARSQEQADLLAKELAGRLPGSAPVAPTRLELRFDRDAMSTIGHVVRADGSSEDLPPVPWPRDGAKVLVSAANDVVGRQFTDLVIAHYQQFAHRQRLIGELLGQADDLERLDASGRHVALIAELKRLGNEKP
jgi:hypothetical protein